jgi:hypothetical protein
MAPEDIDLLIYCGVGRGFLEPANAYFYAKARDMRTTNCFDITDGLYELGACHAHRFSDAACRHVSQCHDDQWRARQQQQPFSYQASRNGSLTMHRRAIMWTCAPFRFMQPKHIGDGRAVGSVRHGFVAWGPELDILPWETPADALRRHTRFPVSLPQPLVHHSLRGCNPGRHGCYTSHQATV